MRLTLVRHATLLIDIGGHRVLVDPMLDAPGARGPVPRTPRPLRNPLVPLPIPPEEVVAGVGLVLLTHGHVDHLDATGVESLPRDVPFACQPEDLPDLAPVGLTGVQGLPADAMAELNGLRVLRAGARHGRDDAAAEALGPVTGYVLEAPGEPTVYVAGDTVWCDEVAAAIDARRPDWIVVNAGGARFLEGATITMEAADVAAVARAAPEARVVAVHMEAINHCLEGRADLERALAEEGLAGRVDIPADGETLT